MDRQKASRGDVIGVLDQRSNVPMELTAEGAPHTANLAQWTCAGAMQAEALLEQVLKAETACASRPTAPIALLPCATHSQTRAAAIAEQLRAHEAHRPELLERVRGGGRLSNQDIAWAHRRRDLRDQLLETAPALSGCAAALVAQDCELLDALERASADCERAWADGQAEADRLERKQRRRRLKSAEWLRLEARWALSDRRYCLRAIRRALTMETAAQVRMEQARRA